MEHKLLCPHCARAKIAVRCAAATCNVLEYSRMAKEQSLTPQQRITSTKAWKVELARIPDSAVTVDKIARGKYSK